MPERTVAGIASRIVACYASVDRRWASGATRTDGTAAEAADAEGKRHAWSPLLAVDVKLCRLLGRGMNIAVCVVLAVNITSRPGESSGVM